MKQKKVTEHELIEIACRMAQELQEFIGDAQESGCENALPGTQALVDEWESIYRRTDESWKSMAVSKNVPDLGTSLLDNL